MDAEKPQPLAASKEGSRADVVDGESWRVQFGGSERHWGSVGRAPTWACKEAWLGSSALHNPGVLTQVSNPSTGDTREAEVQGHAQLRNSPSYTQH